MITATKEQSAFNKPEKRVFIGVAFLLLRLFTSDVEFIQLECVTRNVRTEKKTAIKQLVEDCLRTDMGEQAHNQYIKAVLVKQTLTGYEKELHTFYPEIHAKPFWIKWRDVHLQEYIDRYYTKPQALLAYKDKDVRGEVCATNIFQKRREK